MTYEEWIKEQIDSLNDTQDDFRYGMLKAFELCLEKYFELCLEKYGDTIPFDFDLYQAGLMDVPEEMIKVLDKIRAEIEEYKSRQLTLAIGVDDLEKGKQIALEYVLTILDKYKLESEEKE